MPRTSRFPGFQGMGLCLAVLLAGTIIGTDWANAQERAAPAVVKAEAEAILSGVIPGLIEELPNELGDRFAQDDLLARIDCDIHEANAQAARSESDAAQAIFTTRNSLFARGGIGRSEVEIAQAQAAAARARSLSSQAILKGCELRAPFAGIVVERLVNRYEYVEPGQPILSVVSSASPSVQIIAPSEWLQWVDVGTKGQLRLQATDRAYAIAVTALGPAVDPVSGTVTLLAEFDGEYPGVIPGMSGTVMFE